MPLTQEQINQIRAQDKLPPVQTLADTSSNIDRASELESAWGVARKEERKENRSVGEKILDFTGGKEIGQGLGQAIAQPKIAKQISETQNTQFDIQNKLIQQIKQKKAEGQDVSRLENALTMINDDISATGQGAERQLNPNELTGKQVVGDALQLATTVGTIGGVSGAGAKATGTLGKIPGLTKQGSGAITKVADKVIGSGTGIVKGALKGAAVLGTEGTISGGLYGASTGLQEDKDLKGVLKDTGKGALIGLGTGVALGSIGGAISGGLKGRELRKVALGDKEATGTITKTQVSEKARKLAKAQGFDDVDIDFMQSMKPKDKLQAKKMIELAKKASTDRRAIERPIDVVGDSMTKRIKFIQNKNSTAGKAVDTTAKALKGQTVDAMPVREKALTLLEDIGVTANKNGTPNWSKSIFKKTPELEKKIMKALSDLPAGEIDAYDLHNFKKSIDEVVSYGVGGEGLKGKSASILKAIRNSADEILDTNFKNYNKANTDYKNTRDVLEIANDLFGKKVGISKERGGQLLRSVFSNNTQRPRVLALIEQLDKTSKTYGGKFGDNLIDQALFTEILEDIYGTQATTSLQGQVQRAVHGTKKVIEGVRDPIKGAGELLATGAEKALGISDSKKKKVLEALLR